MSGYKIYTIERVIKMFVIKNFNCIFLIGWEIFHFCFVSPRKSVLLSAIKKIQSFFPKLLLCVIKVDNGTLN